MKLFMDYFWYENMTLKVFSSLLEPCQNDPDSRTDSKCWISERQPTSMPYKQNFLRMYWICGHSLHSCTCMYSSHTSQLHIYFKTNSHWLYKFSRALCIQWYSSWKKTLPCWFALFFTIILLTSVEPFPIKCIHAWQHVTSHGGMIHIYFVLGQAPW